MARFGGLLSAAGVITQVGVNVVDLILGRILGFTAVGLYSRAQGLISLFHRDIMGAVHKVAFPAFATEHREGRDLATPYLRGISLVTVFAWPFYGFVGLMAFPVVRILFGSQWDAAVPLVQILCIAVAIGAIWSLSGHVLIVAGRIGRILKAELIIQPSRIALVVVAAPFGLEMVAAAQIIVYTIGMFVYFGEVFRFIELSAHDIFIATYRSLGTTACSLIVPLSVVILTDIGEDNIWLPLVVASLGASVGWFGGIVLTDHPIRQEIVSVAARFPRLRVR